VHRLWEKEDGREKKTYPGMKKRHCAAELHLLTRQLNAAAYVGDIFILIDP